MAHFRQSQNPYGILFWCWLIYGALYLARLNVAAVLPLLREEMGYSYGQAGLLMSGFYIIYAASQIPAGYLGDRFSSRLVAAGGALISSLANLGFSLSRAFVSLLFFQGMSGMGQAGGWGPNIRIMVNWFPAHRWGTAIGLFSTSVSVFTVLAYVLAASAADRWGWRSSFQIPAIILFAVIAMYMMAVRDRPAVITTHADSASLAGQEVIRHVPFRKVMTDPGMWIILGSYWTLQYLTYGILIWFPSYIKETFNVGLTSAAAIASLVPVMGVLARPLGGYISDTWFGGRRMPMIAGGMAGIFLLLMILAGLRSLKWVVVILPLLGIATQFFHPLYYALPAELLSSEAASTGSGFLDAGGHLASILATLATGLLLDATGSYRLILLSFAAAALFGFIISLKIPDVSR
ncbi:MAG: MFS transporter [Deltaproteobacteria bacterium]|nr:MFS transporter [Deltaproteobacteria bacterium]